MVPKDYLCQNGFLLNNETVQLKNNKFPTVT